MFANGAAVVKPDRCLARHGLTCFTPRQESARFAMFARAAKAASATEMLEELLQCRAGKAAELSVKLLQEQQRTISALEQKLTNQELWQRKTEKT